MPTHSDSASPVRAIILYPVYDLARPAPDLLYHSREEAQSHRPRNETFTADGNTAFMNGDVFVLDGNGTVPEKSDGLTTVAFVRNRSVVEEERGLFAPLGRGPVLLSEHLCRGGGLSKTPRERLARCRMRRWEGSQRLSAPDLSLKVVLLCW
ncbi:hypothetical protein ANO11243_044540 [Dothideomycetidae sp. 11243]|nr:hypothetical protein ANO11243_044540 [fungal sp. No.11243]